MKWILVFTAAAYRYFVTSVGGHTARGPVTCEAGRVGTELLTFSDAATHRGGAEAGVSEPKVSVQ